MKCSLDWVRVSHLLFTFSILRKNLPLKSLKRLNLNQMARITSAKTKLIFFKSNKKMSEMRVFWENLNTQKIVICKENFIFKS